MILMHREIGAGSPCLHGAGDSRQLKRDPIGLPATRVAGLDAGCEGRCRCAGCGASGPSDGLQFLGAGSAFDSDRESQARIMGAVQMATLAAAAQQLFTIAWTLADNTVPPWG